MDSMSTSKLWAYTRKTLKASTIEPVTSKDPLSDADLPTKCVGIKSAIRLVQI